MREEKTLRVAAAWICKGGRVLLARRRDGDEQGGLWEFPGGTAEEGEDLASCLVRELKEELAVTAAVEGPRAQVTEDQGDHRIQLHLFAARIVQGEPQPLGCAEVRWVPVEEIAGLPLAPADRRLLGLLGIPAP